MNDLQAKENYDKYQNPAYTFTTPKERKIRKAIGIKGKDHAYWSKMSSRNLSGMLRNQ